MFLVSVNNNKIILIENYIKTNRWMVPELAT